MSRTDPSGYPAQIHASFPNAKDLSGTNIVDVMQIRRLDDCWSWATEAPSECKLRLEPLQGIEVDETAAQCKPHDEL